MIDASPFTRKEIYANLTKLEGSHRFPFLVIYWKPVVQ